MQIAGKGLHELNQALTKKTKEFISELDEHWDKNLITTLSHWLFKSSGNLFFRQAADQTSMSLLICTQFSKKNSNLAIEHQETISVAKFIGKFLQEIKALKHSSSPEFVKQQQILITNKLQQLKTELKQLPPQEEEKGVKQQDLKRRIKTFTEGLNGIEPRAQVTNDFIENLLPEYLTVITQFLSELIADSEDFRDLKEENQSLKLLFERYKNNTSQQWKIAIQESFQVRLQQLLSADSNRSGASTPVLPSSSSLPGTQALSSSTELTQTLELATSSNEGGDTPPHTPEQIRRAESPTRRQQPRTAGLKRAKSSSQRDLSAFFQQMNAGKRRKGSNGKALQPAASTTVVETKNHRAPSPLTRTISA